MRPPSPPRLTFLLLILLVAPGVEPTSSRAQPTRNADPDVASSSWWDGPYETGISTTYLSGSGAREMRIRLTRTVPLTIGPPRGALQSRVDILPVRAGVRTGLDEGRSFRGSAALLAADVFRSPIAAGLTVLEYGRTGRFEEESRWIDLRAGLSVRRSAGPLAAEPRLVGSIGLTSVRPGRAAWELGPAAAVHTTGLDLGVRADLPIRLVPIGFIGASAGVRTIQGSTDLLEPWMGVELGVSLSRDLAWRTRLRWSELRGPTRSDAHLFAATGLHLRIP